MLVASTAIAPTSRPVAIVTGWLDGHPGPPLELVEAAPPAPPAPLELEVLVVVAVVVAGLPPLPPVLRAPEPPPPSLVVPLHAPTSAATPRTTMCLACMARFGAVYPAKSSPREPPRRTSGYAARVHVVARNIAALCAGAALAACGARSTLEGEAGATAAGASGTGASGTTTVGPTCADATPKAYLCDDGDTLYTFDPTTLVTTPIGQFSCPTGAIPWTMTVDGAGSAYLIYDDWNVYRVDLATLACTQTPYVPGQLGFTGEEGIAVAAVAGVDRFFVFGANPAPTLAVSDLTSFVLSPVGPVTPPNGEFPVAIQGDAFGNLYALSQDSTFFELGSATADVTHLDHVSLPGGGNWAVMAYGDQIYLFGAGGTVGRYDPSAQQLTTLGSVGFSVIGASATPCVP